CRCATRVTNTGPGPATAVTLSAPLTAGSGLVWAIDPDTAPCRSSIDASNTLTCSFGSLASGASKTVHVSSPTTFASCAEYPNTATAQATNHPQVQASASTTVLCPDLAIDKDADHGQASAGSPIGF